VAVVAAEAAEAEAAVVVQQLPAGHPVAAVVLQQPWEVVEIK
jgi:hypothetical protein